MYSNFPKGGFARLCVRRDRPSSAVKNVRAGSFLEHNVLKAFCFIAAMRLERLDASIGLSF